MAVHVLAVLAFKQGDPASSDLLASSINTNPVIVRRLLLVLKRAKLIETRKGAGFGSRLSRSPARINLAEVYRAVEAKEAFAMPPRRPNEHCPVGHGIRAALESVFASAQRALENDLERTSLAMVIEAVQAPPRPGRAKHEKGPRY